jgi:hypothetical protein
MLMRHVLLVTLLAAGLLGWTVRAAWAEEPTYAERLGWPTGAKVVIFHIDDAGMSHDSNVGCFEALDKGLATSVSIMMPCPWVPEFAQYLEKNPKVCAGVHLTLTSEWDKYRWGPVAGKAAVPGLSDKQGCLPDGVADVEASATPEEVEIEIRAQVDRALTMGIQPTHLDSHMGTLFTPKFFPVYMKVGIEMGIPILVPGGHMQFIGQENPELVGGVRIAAEQVWNAGLPVVDDIVASTYDWKQFDEKKANLIKVLETMQPGVLEVIVHCTRLSSTFEHISSSGETRLADLEVMLDPDVKKTIEKQGIVLSNWRELKERRDKAGK